MKPVFAKKKNDFDFFFKNAKKNSKMKKNAKKHNWGPSMHGFVFI